MTIFHARRSAYCIATVLMLAVAGCGGSSPTGGGGGGGGGATTSVNVSLAGYNPEDVSVASGATVRWIWTDGAPHSVTFTNQQIASSIVKVGGDFQTAMPAAAGTYGYRCTVHSFTGSVMVQ